MRSLVLVALLLTWTTSATAVEIASCDAHVRSGDVGDLSSDLDCRAGASWPFSAIGVRVEPGGVLRLNGHTIRGDGTGYGVECFGSGRTGVCTVEGPGEVSGFWAGVQCAGVRVRVRRVLVQGNTIGINGPLACRLVAEGVNVVDNVEDGIWVHVLRARELIATGNGGAGLRAGRLNARAVLAADNGGHGIVQGTTVGRFGRIVDSTATGNGDVDLAAIRVRLRRVRCGRSEKLRWPKPVDSSDDRPTVVGSFGCIDDGSVDRHRRPEWIVEYP